MKKLLTFVIAFNCFLLCMFMSSYAFSGWYNDGIGMRYINSEGYPYFNTWKENYGKLLFLGEDGYVLHNKVFYYNDYIYCVGLDGSRVENSFVLVTDDMIANHNITPGFFYFGSDGKAFSADGQTFIKNIGYKKFAFDESAHLIVNSWLDSNGRVISFPEDILSDGFYLTKNDGSLMHNEWHYFTRDVGYTNNINIDESKYENPDNLWMYFGNNCKKYTDKTNIIIEGKEYSFDEYGMLVTGFYKKSDNTDYTQENNPIIDGKIRYYNESSGELIKNIWFKNTIPENFDELEYDKNKDFWFYIDDEGVLAKNKIYNINDSRYAFDGFGRLRKGFVISDGKGYFVADYNSEDLTKEDFLYTIEDGSKLYGIELANLFYFKETEGIEEGKMATGDLFIELSDGIYEFGFKPSGQAYGEKNKLTNIHNSYYVNGLKLKPWDNESYGIVKVSDDDYRVVDSFGKLVKSKKKSIKTKDGDYLIVINDKLVAYYAQPSQRGNMRWQTINGVTGYHYYDSSNSSYIDDIVVTTGTRTLTDAMLSSIPDYLKINFK